MKSISSKFYKSPAWRACREGYLRQHPFCEECLKRGEYTPATHVHHKTWLNEDNVKDPAVALSWDNLEAVCIECHNKIHFAGKSNRRYTVRADGSIAPLSRNENETIK